MVVSSGVNKWLSYGCPGNGSEPPFPEPLLMCAETGVQMTKLRQFAMRGCDGYVRYIEGVAAGGRYVGGDMSFLKQREKGVGSIASYRNAHDHNC
jgi:hypothetical protein